MISEKRIIGVFDLDKSSQSKLTREFLSRAEEDGLVLDVCDDIPKSFIVYDHPYHEQIVYLSELNSSTLQQRTKRMAARIPNRNRRGET